MRSVKRFACLLLILSLLLVDVSCVQVKPTVNKGKNDLNYKALKSKYTPNPRKKELFVASKSRYKILPRMEKEAFLFNTFSSQVYRHRINTNVKDILLKPRVLVDKKAEELKKKEKGFLW